MNYVTILAEARRRIILSALAESTGYALREGVLVRLLEGERLAIGRDGLRNDLRWLENQGLLTIEYHDQVQAACLTSRGADVAAGRLAVPGIAKPPVN